VRSSRLLIYFRPEKNEGELSSKESNWTKWLTAKQKGLHRKTKRGREKGRGNDYAIQGTTILGKNHNPTTMGGKQGFKDGRASE